VSWNACTDGSIQASLGRPIPWLCSILSALVAAVVVLWPFCAPARAASDIDRTELTRLSRSLVKVEAIDAAGRLWVGTGVAVAPEHVVTSCHITRRGESVRVQRGGMGRLVTAQLADTLHDLCLLLVPNLAIPPARLGQTDTLKPGEAVYALGFEGGLALHARAGVVRALHAYDGARVIESTTPFTSGASGGALFDAEGRLVAILTYRLRGDRRSYFSVPVEWFIPRLGRDDAYAAVGPLDGTLPFWQGRAEELPFFLRAHQMETDGDWSGLLSLTDEWCRADDTNAEAWLFRGKGLAETQNLAGARLAFQRAVALDPISSDAWLRLGRLAAQGGLIEEAEAALTQLNRLNPELAQCLALTLRPALEQQDYSATNACSAI
jgi:serine protease Do